MHILRSENFAKLESWECVRIFELWVVSNFQIVPKCSIVRNCRIFESSECSEFSNFRKFRMFGIFEFSKFS